MRTDSIGWSSVPPRSTIADDSPMADERDVDRQLLGHPHEEEVHVERPAIDRVDLDRGHQHRLGLRPVDGQVDQRVRAGMPAQLLELVGIDRDAVRGDAVAVDDRRQAAGVAETGDLLAGQLAMFGGQRRAGGGHVVEPLGRWWSGSGLRLAGGAGVARRPVASDRVPRLGARSVHEDARPGSATRGGIRGAPV